MKRLNRPSILQTVRKVLAADFACDEGCLLAEGVFISQAKRMEGRRAFPFRESSLSIMTMGKGVIISCSLNYLEWVQESLKELDRDQFFSPSTFIRLENYVNKHNQTIAGPDLKYICSLDTFRPVKSPVHINLNIYGKEQISRLYRYEGFHNALKYQFDTPRPDVLASVATSNGQIVGIAGASADCDEIWQIGVDIIPAYRGCGIGKALVSSLTEAIFQKGKIPYYSTVVSNLPSRNLAISLGYWPVWVELYSREADTP